MNTSLLARIVLKFERERKEIRWMDIFFLSVLCFSTSEKWDSLKETLAQVAGKPFLRFRFSLRTVTYGLSP